MLEYYGLSVNAIPDIVPTFGEQGRLSVKAADELGLTAGIPISYRAGDQPNNAFSLNVVNSGEVAATAGTSGVVYGVTDLTSYDKESRINTFAHVNYSDSMQMKGVLLCINGTGIQNSWLRNEVLSGSMSYEQMNEAAGKIPIGSEGIKTLPYGNGAERSLANKDIRGGIYGLNFNKHGIPHLLRSAQEGIVFAFMYGMEIMKEVGVELKVIRAGKANMFLSPIFKEAFSNTSNSTIELYNTDGSQGAARGAGVGAGVYNSIEEAFAGLKIVESVSPQKELVDRYSVEYGKWREKLEILLAESP